MDIKTSRPQTAKRVATLLLTSSLCLSGLVACSSEEAGPGRATGDGRFFAGPQMMSSPGTPGLSAGPATAGMAGSAIPSIQPPVITAGPPMDDVCSDAMITPVISGGGNLLVIFDRSTSMATPFSETETRLEAVNSALTSAIGPFVCEVSGADEEQCVELLQVGAILFPSADSLGGLLGGFLGGAGGGAPGGGGGLCPVDPITSDKQINWQLTTPFINSWNGFWSGPNGVLFPGTPIPAAFQQAEAALTMDPPPGATTVLFLTDGESNCVDGVDPVMQAAAWFERGIRTYVVSVAPGDSTFNDQVAQAGGTDMSLNPTDTQQLADTLQEIINKTVEPISCVIELEGDGIADLAGACEKGEVLLGATVLPCDPNSGFQIRGATTIEIMGEACTRLQEGKSRLRASFPCDVLLQ